ncbi:GntR family transcriptional regulator [Neorhizobium lilium]|uniref:GntR family transcriptional regulator n=1 Tax=Neorhizobium lilium TaxID=2503024 RepID=A0A3S3RKU8_9HYPH|nr:GntR family transcriptional regulator [Neorhizobium lilium]RWX80826.1 GntR family transcriptional regulator [Neorhizobium lilium]
MANIAQKLYQRAFEILEEEIRTGRMEPGARLTETGLATRFGISRAPARQALGELERSGLINRAGARGYEVANQGSVSSVEPRQPIGIASGIGEKIQFLPSWELIYRQVEIEIVSRTSLASWRINEAALAKTYDVSRTVARDVMGRLQQRGIVRKDDSGRWYAPGLTAKHINELYELRWVLEPLALEKAVPHLPADLLPRLATNVAAANAAITTVDSRVLDALEQELHVELLSYCGNDALMQAISLPQALLVAHHFLYHAAAHLFETEPFLPEHLAVIERLSAGHVGEAREALVKHLQVSRERAMLRIRAVAETISPRDLPYIERLVTPQS